MKEIKEIIGAYDLACAQGRKTALATVVHVDGSSYRRPGARMLITDEGQLTGAISGGCLEGDALRKAQLVLFQQKKMLVTYDTTDEDDAKLGVGLGCNGIIQVLIEPLRPEDPANPVAMLKMAASQRQKAVACTLFSLQHREVEQPGTCLLLKEDELVTRSSGSVPFGQMVEGDARRAMALQESTFRNYISGNENFVAFIEFLKPVVSLVVVGAGNDVQPLVAMAGVLGWETRIVDGRANYARQERFGSACQVLVSKPEKALEQLSIDDQTVFLLMTHNYNYDLAMLRELLRRNVKYIGSLGPRSKLDRMLNELKDEGIVPGREQLKNLYGPCGLDIGAETPEEIALSILAEVKAVLSGRGGQKLRESVDVIHPRSETHIEKIRVGG